MPETVVKTEEQEDKEYADFFKEALDGDKPVDQAALDKAAAVKQKEEADRQAASDLPADDVFTPSPTPDVSESGACENCKALEAEIAKVKNDTAAWNGRIRKANERADAAEQELQRLKESPVKAKAPESAEEPSAEEDAVLAQFAEDYPDFVKPLEILSKRKAAQLVEKRMATLEPDIKSMKESSEQATVADHVNKITAAHSDWKDIRDSGKLKTWIDSQPSFLKASLEKVYREGDTQEIIEMFDTYKRVNGLSPKTNTSGDKPKKDAADLLAVPASGAGIPKGKPDPNDYDAAWKEANLGKK